MWLKTLHPYAAAVAPLSNLGAIVSHWSKTFLSFFLLFYLSSYNCCFTQLVLLYCFTEEPLLEGGHNPGVAVSGGSCVFTLCGDKIFLSFFFILTFPSPGRESSGWKHVYSVFFLLDAFTVRILRVRLPPLLSARHT